MPNDGPEDKEKPQRSLLSLASVRGGDGVREGGAAVPPAFRLGAEEDPVAVHRRARSRREAKPSPLIAALNEPAVRPTTPQQSEVYPANQARSWSRRIAEGLAGLRKPSHPIGADFAEPIAGPAHVADRRETLEAPASVPAGDQVWQPLIDPARVILGIARSKALIAATTILGALIGVAIALSTPKKYESAAELLIDPRDLQLVDRTLTQGGLPSDATLAIVENQVRVITSGSVLNTVVERLNLDNDPEFNGQRESFSLGTIIDKLRSLISRNGGSSGGDRRRALAVEGLAKSLSVERGGKTFVVVVAATTEEPEKSALIANTITQVFLETYGRIQSDTATRATDELTSRLDELRAGVEQSERAVEAFKAENDLIDAQGRLISDDEIVRLNEQLAIARARTAELNVRAQSTRTAGVDAALQGVLPEEIASNTMVELRSQFVSLRREADRLSARLGPRHPQFRSVESELAGLREEIASELRRIVSSVQTELRRQVQLEQDLAARLAQLKVRQGDVSNDLVTLREMEREASAKRSVYEAYLLRARETGEQKDINMANMSVISKAFAPLESVGPSRAVMSITGMIMGFIAGVALGAVRGALSSLRANVANRRRLRPTPAAVEAKTATPAAPSSRAPAPETSPVPIDQETKPMFSMLERVLRPSRTAEGSQRSATEGPATPTSAVHANPAAEAVATSYPHAQPVPPVPQQPYPAAHPGYFPAGAVYAQSYPVQYPMPAPMMGTVMPQGHMMSPPGGYPAQGHVPQGFSQPYPYPVQQPGPVIWPAMQPYPPQPAPAYPYATPDPSAASSEAARLRNEIDGVRESLREFREAVRDLTENRARNRAY